MPIDFPMTLLPYENIFVNYIIILLLSLLHSDYVTWSDYHQNHLTLFPSLKPSSRYEAVALRVKLQ